MIGRSHHNVPSLSNVAMRSASATNVRDVSSTIEATPSSTACFVAPSRHDGSGSWSVPIEAIDRLAPASRAAEITTCVDEIEGDHTFVTFGALLERAFPWLMTRLGLAPSSVAAEEHCGDGA